MKKYILGRKIGMTQVMEADGIVVPVTVLSVGPCKVVKVNSTEKEGYDAVVLGYDEVSEKRVNKAVSGFFKKINQSPLRVIREFRVDAADAAKFSVGQEISAGLFAVDENVDVRSKSIGKGFAGTIKRHGFSRGPMTHGSKNHRLPGSIGGGTTPGRVIKGKKMPGHMGDANVTVKNLRVAFVDGEKGILYVKGAVPGKKGNLVEIFN
jgi:large subunit ribosomal protein L3